MKRATWLLALAQLPAGMTAFTVQTAEEKAFKEKARIGRA
jgi:hypothetical protein